MGGLKKEEFQKIAPSLIGLNIEDAAKIVNCTPGSLRARLSVEGYKTKIRKGEILDLKSPEENNKKPKFSWEITPKPTPIISPKPPIIIRLSNPDYDNLVRNFRTRNHRSFQF